VEKFRYSWQFLTARQVMWYALQGDFGYAWRKVWLRMKDGDVVEVDAAKGTVRKL